MATAKTYQWLIVKDTSTPVADILELNETLTDNSLIIRDERINKYICFESVAVFEKKYNGDDHTVHEVIMGWMKQRPKFDIDSGDINSLEEIIEHLESSFIDNYDLVPDIVRCSSSNDEKFSYHLIIRNCYFENNIEAKWFYDQFKKSLPVNLQQHVDWTVNKRIQCFRILGSVKNGRVKRAIDKKNGLYDTLITTISGISLPKWADYDHKPAMFCETITKDIANPDPYIWRFSKRINNLVTFTRIRMSYCDLCERDHTSVGMYIAKHQTCVTRHCYQSKKCHTINTTNDMDVDDIVVDIMPVVVDIMPVVVDIMPVVVDIMPVVVDIMPVVVDIMPMVVDITQKYTGFYQVVDQYHGALLPTQESMKGLVDALRQVILIKLSGTSSLAMVKINENDFELQKFRSLIIALDYNYVIFESKKVTFTGVIQLNLNQFKYRSIVFAPMKLAPKHTINLFTGIKASPVENAAIIAPIINHIYSVWASKSDEVFVYIIDWLASIIQGIKTGTVIVLYSARQGAGKNVISDFICNKVIGNTYSAETNDIENLVSKFNNIFANKIFTVINEANNVDGSPANYHKTFDKLKDLITSPTVTIERKGIDSFKIDDYNNYLITTNNEYPVKLSEHDRRYTLLKIDESMTGNKDYFDILHEHTSGEYSADCANAFLYYLQSRVIVSNIRVCLTTTWKETIVALQKPTDPIMEWIDQTSYTESQQITGVLYDDYRIFCDRTGLKPTSKIMLFKRLKSTGIVNDAFREICKKEGRCVATSYCNLAAIYVHKY